MIGPARPVPQHCTRCATRHCCSTRHLPLRACAPLPWSGHEHHHPAGGHPDRRRRAPRRRASLGEPYRAAREAPLAPPVTPFRGGPVKIDIVSRVHARDLRKHHPVTRFQDRTPAAVSLACSSLPKTLVTAPPSRVGFPTTSRRRAYRNRPQLLRTWPSPRSQPPHAEGRIETSHFGTCRLFFVFRSQPPHAEGRIETTATLVPPTSTPVPNHLTPKGV